MLETLIWIVGILVLLVICLVGYAVIKTLFWGGKQVRSGVTKGSEAIKNRRAANKPAKPKTTVKKVNK